MKRIFLLLALSLACSSCGIFRFRSSERYLPGPAIRDYQPQGLVEEVQYPSSVPGPTHRRMIVYLPADYYRTQERYPVFYLLHGARGYETAWIRFGKVYETTDSLCRTGKAVPCIVVMPNVNQYNDDKDYEGGRFKDAWESIWEVDGVVESAFAHDVVDLVDSLYRTIPDKEHRAVAGLSVGGYQSIWLSANHPQLYGYVGAFSPYMWCLGKSNPYKKQFYSKLFSKQAAQFANPPQGYYIYAGEKDIMRPATEDIHHKMERRGYSHQYFIFPGGHDWINGGWIEEYQDMLQRIFKTQDP